MTKKETASLLSREATGGDIAEGGFKYQDHLLLARIPRWLTEDGFDGFIREAMGDSEARFYVPRCGTKTEFLEFKNHVVQRNEFNDEIRRFRDMDESAPYTYLKFVLVCKGVSEKLKPVLNALRQLRDPYPFYDNAPTIQQASYQDYVDAIGRGSDGRFADFIFKKVFIEVIDVDAEQLAREVFREQLHLYFPILEQASGTQVNAARSALLDLVSAHKRKWIKRSQIERTLWKHFPEFSAPQVAIRFHTESNFSSDREFSEGRLVFRWIPFFGDGTRSYPPSEDWDNVLMKELTQTRNWIESTERSRIVHLSGARRLTASIALGYVFSAVAGFSIRADFRGNHWWTSNEVDNATPGFAWREKKQMGGTDDELVVNISICRNISENINKYLQQHGMDHISRLELHSDIALTSDKHTNKSVAMAKERITDALSMTGATKVHLFCAVPSCFALYLGHRLNATCTIQCYEFVGSGQYTKSCRLPAS